MRRRKEPPPEADMTLPCGEIANVHGVSVPTACRWKREAGTLMPVSRSANRTLWGMVTEFDWEQGNLHVAKLMRVSPQAAQKMREMLLSEGHNLPKLKRGRPRKSG